MKRILMTSVLGLSVFFGTAHGLGAESSDADSLREFFKSSSQNVPRRSARSSANQQPLSASSFSYLPRIEQDLFLRGEHARLNWEMHLLEVDLAESVVIDIAFNNSAVVSPERSRIQLIVNGNLVSEAPLRFAGDTGHLVSEVPRELLRLGKNEITVLVDQRHRVDCSFDATYELWTKVDPDKSKIRFGAEERVFRNLDDLASLPRSYGQVERVNFLLPGHSANGIDPLRAEGYLELVQKISVFGDFKKPQISTESAADLTHQGAPALDLFVGSLKDLKKVKSISDLYDLERVAKTINRSTDGFAIVPSKTGARHLVIQYGSLAGQAARFDRVSDEHVSLDQTSISVAELGFQEMPFYGQRFTQDFPLELPADFYPSDYDSIRFHLFAGLGANLKTNQSLMLSVNGVTVLSLSLNNASSELLENKILEIPLSAFRPGSNTVSMTVQLQRENNEACLYVGQQIQEEPFFLSGSSFFEIPKLARLGRFPDLNNTLKNGFPYRYQDNRGDLWVNLKNRDEIGLKLAAEFLTNTAVKSGTPFPIRVTSPGLTTGEEPLNQLIVAPFSNVSERYANWYNGVDFAALKNFWSNQYASRDTLDYIATGTILENGYRVPQNADESTSSEDLGQPPAQGPTGQPEVSSQPNYVQNASFQQQDDRYLDIKRRLEQNAFAKRRYDFFDGLLFKVSGLIAPLKATAANLWNSDDEPPSITNNAGLVITQIPEENRVTTIIAYPQSVPAEITMVVFDTNEASDEGLVHTVGTSTGSEFISQLKSDQPLEVHLTNDSWGNLRLVIAGWFSDNPFLYGGMFMLTLLSCGLITTLMLNRTERHKGVEFENEF